MKKKIGFWKVFGKLISTHWRSHLLFPFIVALLVEPGWGWASLKYQSVGAFIFSREGLVSHLSIASIIVTYIGVALWDIHKHTKASWTNVSGEQLKVALEDVVDFFATCTIPLEQWFEPDTQKYLSDLVKHKYENNLRQNRVLMFKREIDLLAVSQQHLSEYHARTLVSIHENYSIPLGFLRPDEIGSILNNFDLKGKALEWEKLKTMTGPGGRGTISTLDFALLTDAQGNHKVYTFDKTGDYIELVVIKDKREVQPYMRLRDDIWQVVFDERNLPNVEHDFAVYCGMSRLTLPQPSVTV